jgi:hypothetical protein
VFGSIKVQTFITKLSYNFNNKKLPDLAKLVHSLKLLNLIFNRHANNKTGLATNAPHGIYTSQISNFDTSHSR